MIQVLNPRSGRYVDPFDSTGRGSFQRRTRKIGPPSCCTLNLSFTGAERTADMNRRSAIN